MGKVAKYVKSFKNMNNLKSIHPSDKEYMEKDGVLHEWVPPVPGAPDSLPSTHSSLFTYYGASSIGGMSTDDFARSRSVAESSHLDVRHDNVMSRIVDLEDKVELTKRLTEDLEKEIQILREQHLQDQFDDEEFQQDFEIANTIARRESMRRRSHDTNDTKQSTSRATSPAVIYDMILNHSSKENRDYSKDSSTIRRVHQSKSKSKRKKQNRIWKHNAPVSRHAKINGVLPEFFPESRRESTVDETSILHTSPDTTGRFLVSVSSIHPDNTASMMASSLKFQDHNPSSTPTESRSKRKRERSTLHPSSRRRVSTDRDRTQTPTIVEYSYNSQPPESTGLSITLSSAPPKWCTVQKKTTLRSGRDLDSDLLMILEPGRNVHVVDIVDRRAFIDLPVEGWVSIRARDGENLLEESINFPHKSTVQPVDDETFWQSLWKS